MAGPRRVASLLLAGLVAGCAPDAPVEVTVSPGELRVEGVVDGPTPSSEVAVSFGRWGLGVPPLRVHATSVGIEAVVPTGGPPGVTQVQVRLRAPGALGPGTYRDVVTIDACADQACSHLLAGGPHRVPVTYLVRPALASVVPTPVASALSPDWARVGEVPEGGLTLAVGGTGFLASSLVLWNGVALPTTFVSHSRLEAALPAEAIQGAARNEVVVSNAWLDGGVSAPLSFWTFDRASPPRLAALSPASVPADQQDFVLTVAGQGFDPGAVVLWNGSPLFTTWAGPDVLTAPVPNARFTAPGQVEVTVLNPQATGGASTPLPFAVEPLPAPTIVALDPPGTVVGADPLEVTVTGAHLGRSTTVVLWNGMTRPTTVVSDTVARFSLTGEDLDVAGVATVAVRSVGATSAARPFPIDRGTLDSVSIQVDPAHGGEARISAARLPDAGSWSVELGGTPGYPLVAGGKVLLTVTRDGGTDLLALDPSTGALAWGPVPLPGLAQAASEGGRVFVQLAAPGQPASLRAFSIDGGAPLWTRDLGVLPALPWGLTVAGGRVYTWTAARDLVALDSATGASLWSFRAFGPGGAPAVSDTLVLLDTGCFAGSLAPADGGALGWGGTIDCPSPWPRRAPPALAPPWVYRIGRPLEPWSAGWVGYAPSGNYMYQVNSEALLATRGLVVFRLEGGSLWAATYFGQQLWRRPGAVTAPVLPPLVVNRFLFLAEGSMLHALSTADGGELATYALPAPVPPGLDLASEWTPASGMAAGNGLLVVPTATGVTALRLSDAP